MSISEVARHYKFSFAGTAKHLDVMARAGLILKDRKGKEQIVALNPKALSQANIYLQEYRDLWENRLDSLEIYLNEAITKG